MNKIAYINCIKPKCNVHQPVELLLTPIFVLPTTNVTLSVIDFNVATASSCVTFSKFRSPCKKQNTCQIGEHTQFGC